MVLVPQIFKKGDIVRHISGGRAEIRDLQNDWSTSPPTVVATVRCLGLLFGRIGKSKVSDLTLEKKGGIISS